MKGNVEDNEDNIEEENENDNNKNFIKVKTNLRRRKIIKQEK